MPTPSPAQNVPNDVSIMPTTNFRVFSGTRVSGWWTTTATPVTSTAAATAPITAGIMSPAVRPKVITINTTSSPSSSTPLNDTVNATQSIEPAPDPEVTATGSLRSSATSRA